MITHRPDPPSLQPQSCGFLEASLLPLHSSQIWRARLQSLASRSHREIQDRMLPGPCSRPLIVYLQHFSPGPQFSSLRASMQVFQIPDMNLILSWDQHGIFRSSMEIFCFLGTLKTAPSPIGSWPHNATRLTVRDFGSPHRSVVMLLRQGALVPDLFCQPMLPEWPWTTDLVDLLLLPCLPAAQARVALPT